MLGLMPPAKLNLKFIIKLQKNKGQLSRVVLYTLLTFTTIFEIKS